MLSFQTFLSVVFLRRETSWNKAKSLSLRAALRMKKKQANGKIKVRNKWEKSKSRFLVSMVKKKDPDGIICSLLDKMV